MKPVSVRTTTRYINYAAIAFTCVFAVSCDSSSVLFCGDNICLSFQDDCSNNLDSQSNCVSAPKQCEAESSIRDRAPQIITQLRETERACAPMVNLGGNAREVVWDNELAQIAASHARDMANNNFESFIGSDGLSTNDRLMQSGVVASTVSESINTGSQTTAEVINAWLDIDTDCAHLMNAQTTRVGLSCALPSGTNGEPYWSLLLATPAQ